MLKRISFRSPDFKAELAALCERSVELPAKLEKQVRSIVTDVRARGDEAVREYTERFEKRSSDRSSFEVTPTRWEVLARKVDADVAEALEFAASRIRSFHLPQLPTGYTVDRGTLGLRVEPLGRVGVYVPGGTANYPSSVLMSVIPARIAGVKEVIMVTPSAAPEVLSAAKVAGVDRVFEIGGAQAIAALAYGTETVPRVDKIVGPGNQWVAAAKRMVFGDVDIDAIAGPSEVLVVADESANPAWVAADLLAQAEHDENARVILVATAESVIKEVERELEHQLKELPRKAIASAALRDHGTAVIADSVDGAVDIANQYAPEHLQLCVERAHEASYNVKNAGAILIGAFSPEAAGDYLAGPNHVLPTGGTARHASPLGVYDFCKFMSVISLNRLALAAVREDIERLATVEGLVGHQRSIALRFASRRAATVVLPPDEIS